MSDVWLIRADDYEGEPIAGVAEVVRNGKACIAWSHEDQQDLKEIETKVNAGKPLDAEQKTAKRNLRLLKINRGDIILYPNQPARNFFMVCRVTGTYHFSKRGIVGTDFRSYLPCEFMGVVSYDDPAVPSKLRSRFGIQGRLNIFAQSYAKLLYHCLETHGIFLIGSAAKLRS